MRKTLAATLALCPMLLHAQAKPLAQQVASTHAPAMMSRLEEPKIGSAAAGATPTARRTRAISTGVTAPHVLSTTELNYSPAWNWAPSESDRVAVVHLIVQPDGTPTNLSVIKSPGALMDQELLSSVSKYRFSAGSLDNQPTPVEMNLTITVHRQL